MWHYNLNDEYIIYNMLGHTLHLKLLTLHHANLCEITKRKKWSVSFLFVSSFAFNTNNKYNRLNQNVISLVIHISRLDNRTHLANESCLTFKMEIKTSMNPVGCLPMSVKCLSAYDLFLAYCNFWERSYRDPTGAELRWLNSLLCFPNRNLSCGRQTKITENTIELSLFEVSLRMWANRPYLLYIDGRSKKSWRG